VTWGSGTTGVSGAVSLSNSLVGDSANDEIGDITKLSNGNYIVRSNSWDAADGMTDAGSVTWASGFSGKAGKVSAANSLLGSTTNPSLPILGETLSDR